MSSKHSRPYDLSGQVALITGGKSGLGFDMAQAFAEQGCLVILTSRDSFSATTAAQWLSQTCGRSALGLQLEQTDPLSVRKMVQDALAWQGHIDILVNNAGGGSGKGECDFLNRDPQEIQHLVAANLTGVILVCQAVGRYMAQAKRGTIINIASIAALVGRDRAMYLKNMKMQQPVEYAAAKAGILGLTRDLAAYLAPFGVRVNAISPGGFNKGDLPPAFVRTYAAATPLGRMGSMGEDIKGAALFLASTASAYVTGQNLVVDGGFSICK